MSEDVHICVHEADLGSIMAKQENFERWQVAQNGTLARIETKIENSLSDIKKEVDESLSSNHKDFSDNLANVNRGFNENWTNLNVKFDRLNAWLYGLMGSLILSLILLIADLALHLRG